MPRYPGVNHPSAVKALEKAGFWIARQGKHIVMTDGSRGLRDWRLVLGAVSGALGAAFSASGPPVILHVPAHAE